jgi:hypothetical protein
LEPLFLPHSVELPPAVSVFVPCIVFLPGPNCNVVANSLSYRPEPIMAKSESTTEDYDDHRTCLAKQPYDILVGWVVCCIALGAIVEFWRPAPPLGLDPSTVREAVKSAPLGNPKEDDATLADEMGMVAKGRK